MYSLFDDLFSTPRFYSARPRVYVISDSEYKAAQDRKNAERVAHLENVRADLLDSVNKVEEQIAELQPSLPEAKEAAKAPAPAVEPAGVKAPVAVWLHKGFWWYGRATETLCAIGDAPNRSGAFSCCGSQTMVFSYPLEKIQLPCLQSPPDSP